MNLVDDQKKNAFAKKTRETAHDEDICALTEDPVREDDPLHLWKMAEAYRVAGEHQEAQILSSMIKLDTSKAPAVIRVVVIDDEDDVRETLMTYLKRKGYEVLGFAGPPMCETMCHDDASCADVIISDIRMPEMDGVDFLVSLKKRGCLVPHMALLSGFWTEPQKKMATEYGIEIFSKPPRLASLAQWLEICRSTIPASRTLCNECKLMKSP